MPCVNGGRQRFCDNTAAVQSVMRGLESFLNWKTGGGLPLTKVLVAAGFGTLLGTGAYGEAGRRA